MGWLVCSLFSALQCRSPLTLGDQLPQNVRQNSSVLIVVHFYRCIDSQYHRDLLAFAVLTMDCQRQLLPWTYAVFKTCQIEALTSIQLERLSAGAFVKLTRQH